MANKKTTFLHYYNEYKDKIYNYFYYRVNFNEAMAEDLTSEVFLKALDKFDNFDISRPFQAWIYAIAHNHLCNYYRVANREIELDETRADNLDLNEKVSALVEINRIVAIIHTLDDYCRDILLLKYVDQMESAEIAELLGKQEGAVRTQLSRAIKILRGKYEELNS